MVNATVFPEKLISAIDGKGNAKRSPKNPIHKIMSEIQKFPYGIFLFNSPPAPFLQKREPEVSI